MKPSLAWFSPVAPQPTEVANYTARLRPELLQIFSVRSYTETVSGFRSIDTGQQFDCDPGTVPSELLREVNRADLPIYHIGNNHDFHLNTWILSRRKPGLVVLHDRKLHHFVDGVYKHRIGDRATYLRYMRTLYGELGLEAATRFCEGKLSIDFMADHFPLTELAIENALGIIVHTMDSFRAVRAITESPVFRLPLPYPSQPAHGRGRAAAKFSPENPATIVIFGFLGPNRRVTEFLTAFAAFSERAAFQVEIVGGVSDTLALPKLIAQHELQAIVRLRGYVTEVDLDSYLAHADLAVNLRYPSAGEASGSQLRIWDHALPSLVTQTEGYAELPGEIVCFVRPDHETADIQKHLRAFLKNPQLFREQGARGKTLLEHAHRPLDYVTRLGEVCDQLGPLRTRRVSFDLATRVGTLSGQWLAEASSLADSEVGWAKRINELFSSASP